MVDPGCWAATVGVRRHKGGAAGSSPNAIARYPTHVLMTASHNIFIWHLEEIPSPTQ